MYVCNNKKKRMNIYNKIHMFLFLIHKASYNVRMYNHHHQILKLNKVSFSISVISMCISG